jgi:hypothetical protein
MSAALESLLPADSRAAADLNDRLTGIHPTISAFLAPHLLVALEARRSAYLTALRKHDWHYEHADDGAVWRRGNAERAMLLIERAAVDSDGLLWNLYAPDGQKVRV